MPSTITTLADLLKSAVTYQQQLVQMPAIGARCDLLTNSYLRSITNTLFHGDKRNDFVVIC